MEAKEILRKLISFNTIQDKENNKIIDYIENLLIDKGFKTDYKTKCLIMSIKDKQKLGFLGHTDTVKSSEKWTMDPLNMKEDSGRLYGLGTCDMKGGIAAILSAIIDIDWGKQNSGIKVYFTYDEEVGFLGIKELVNRKEKFPDNMIIGEPTNNEIMSGSKGLLELNMKFSGVAAHASTPQKGENAIEKCIKFINELNTFYDELKNDENKAFEIPYTTMNIGKINGGNSVNIVPNSCELMVDFRPIDRLHIVKIEKEVEELLKKYDGEYKIIEKLDPFISKGNNIKTTNFITEGSFIDSPNRYILGVGPLNLHQADEYITLESLEELTYQYKELINKFCK